MVQTPYNKGGFKVWDISDKSKPKLITHHKTHGRGVHRFDMDENYAYNSTEMPGYVGNILVIYDLKNPARPEEVSRWTIPGQHIGGGEKPAWQGRAHRLHHTVRVGNRLYAGCWGTATCVLSMWQIRLRRREVGWYIPQPCGGRSCPQSNDRTHPARISIAE